MTKSCGDRIFIGEFIKILEKVNFNELTEEKCKELFVNHDFQWLNKFDDTSKDIAIDDYVFTVHLMSDDEVISKFYRNYNCNGFRINDMVLSICMLLGSLIEWRVIDECCISHCRRFRTPHGTGYPEAVYQCL